LRPGGGEKRRERSLALARLAPGGEGGREKPGRSWKREKTSCHVPSKKGAGASPPEAKKKKRKRERSLCSNGNATGSQLYREGRDVVPGQAWGGDVSERGRKRRKRFSYRRKAGVRT